MNAVLRGVVAALVVAPCSAGAAGKLGYSTSGSDLPLGVNPTAEGSYELEGLPVAVTLGGEYSYAAHKFSPKKLTLALAKAVGDFSIKAKLAAAGHMAMPELTAEATIAHELGSVTVDATEPTPKLVEAAPISFGLATLTPKWRPRVKGSAGLSLDVDSPFSKTSDRALISATLVPEQRPEVTFSFKLDDGAVDITPLLGEGAKATKFEYEKTGLPHGASVKASLLGQKLSLAAKVATAAGDVAPTVDLDLSKLGAKPKLSLKQSYAL